MKHIDGTIICVHGFMNNPLLMSYLGCSLGLRNYKVAYFNYSSLSYDDSVLLNLHELIMSIKIRPLYLIGHSMGGLVIRNYLDRFYSDQSAIAGIITIATPHNGSQCAVKFYSTIFGFMLKNAKNSGLISGLPPWRHNLLIGCIQGVSTSIFAHNWFLERSPSIGDGTILVAEAYLEGAANIRINGSHTGLLFNATVVKQILYFLKHRRFSSILLD